MLVVEDEPRVRKLTVTRLRTLGYRVLEAANGPAALDLLRAAPDVDLVFTDLVMPGGMTGADLARQIYATRPNVRVLFTSGYAEPELLKQGLAQGARWLKKPYTATDLARTLREIFDAGLAG